MEEHDGLLIEIFFLLLELCIYNNIGFFFFFPYSSFFWFMDIFFLGFFFLLSLSLSGFWVLFLCLVFFFQLGYRMDKPGKFPISFFLLYRMNFTNYLFGHFFLYSSYRPMTVLIIKKENYDIIIPCS